MKYSIAIGVAVAVCLRAASAGAWGDEPPQGLQPAQPRVVWTEDPAHEATVSWTTAEFGPSVLHFGPRPMGPAWREHANHQACVTFQPAFVDDFVHHCRIQTASSTTVYFTMETAGKVAPELHFVSAPDDDRSFRLLVGGDSRSDVQQRRSMNRLMARLLDDDSDIIALAHGGDYVETGSRWSQWRQWLTDHELTTTPSGRVLPIIPVRGNHEARGALYDAVFDTPGARQCGGNYYRTKIGGFVMLSLNTNIPHGGAQRAFIDWALGDAARSARWLVAHYHRAAYPAVKAPGDARIFWVPLFDQHRADLVFESDGHALKRTIPIADDAPHEGGVVYVGEGGLGVPQRTPATDRWYLAPPGRAQSAHHVQRLTVTPLRLLYDALDANARLLDHWEARVRRRVPEGRPAPPPRRCALAEYPPYTPPAGPIPTKAMPPAPEGRGGGCRTAPRAFWLGFAIIFFARRRRSVG